VIDAYDLQQKIMAQWGQLALIPSAASINKKYNEVPVYVILNNNTYTVIDVITRDGKIILEIIWKILYL